jgi:hypothetical protein
MDCASACTPRLQPGRHADSWVSCRRKKGKKIASFYSDQNDHIQDMLKPLSTLSAEGEQDVRDNALKVKIAVNLSFACNAVLAVVQLYAAISSLSLALFASCIDAGERIRTLARINGCWVVLMMT